MLTINCKEVFAYTNHPQDFDLIFRNDASALISKCNSQFSILVRHNHTHEQCSFSAHLHASNLLDFILILMDLQMESCISYPI